MSTSASPVPTVVLGATRPTGRGRLNLLWGAIVLAAVLGLAAGSGALGGGGAKPTSLYQRTLQVAGEYRCPVCQGAPAAASGAPEAVEIRAMIGKWLAERRTPAQIRSYLVADYGPAILERPPASGFGAALWVVPVLAFGAAAVGLGVAFSRWRRAAATGLAPTTDGTTPGTGDTTQGRLFDLEAMAPARPRTLPSATPSTPARRRYQRVTLVSGVALMVLAGALWLVDRTSSARLPGDTISGGVTGVSAELQQASALAPTEPAEALALYNEVLVSDPDQPVALTGEGWIYSAAGYPSKGMQLLDKVEATDPSYGPAHFYRGIVLLDYERKPAQAAAEMTWYLAHSPAPSLEAQAKEALALARAEA